MLVNLFNANYGNPNTPNFGSKRIDLDMKVVKKYISKGLSFKEIAQKMGVSYSTVYTRCNEIGLSAKKKPQLDYDRFDKNQVQMLIEDGNSLRQIGEVLGVGTRTVRSILNHFGLKTQQSSLLSSINKEKLIAMINMGKSQQEIARAFMIEDTGALTPLIRKYGGVRITQAKADKITDYELKSLIESGESIAKIAKRYNVAPKFIREKMEEYSLNTPRIISNEQVISLESLIQCINSGMTVKEIATSLKAGVSKIVKLLRDNNLKTHSQLKRQTRNEK